jgi:hypothetical protein
MHHGLRTSESFYGTLAAGNSECSGDSIGYIELCGAPDVLDDMEATGCRIDECRASESPMIQWDGCFVGTLTYSADSSEWPYLRIQHCLVAGDLNLSSARGRQGRGEPPSTQHRGCGIEHNTILGALRFEYTADHEPSPHSIRSNIIVAPSVVSTGDPGFITHNDFAGGVQLAAPSSDVFDNIEADPLFCNELAGDYTIHEDSPCVGAAHDGSAIGAYSVGCGVPVERASWGSIKAKYN